MILNTRNAEAISRVVAEKGWTALESIRFTDATLSGLMEFGRLLCLDGQDYIRPAVQTVSNAPEALPYLEKILGYFDEGTLPSVGWQRPNAFSPRN